MTSLNMETKMDNGDILLRDLTRFGDGLDEGGRKFSSNSKSLDGSEDVGGTLGRKGFLYKT